MSGLIEYSADARSKTIGQNFRVRAWVHFDGQETASNMINASGNVSSITDNATGDYTVNFTSEMPDVFYSVASVQSFIQAGNGPNATVNINRVNSNGNEVALSASSVRVNTSNTAGNDADMKHVNIIVVK